jgi:DNA primase
MKVPNETLCSVLYADLETRVVVFTEDWLSAVRIQLLGFNAVCCFGTTIRTIERCIDLGDKAYVWLDNDNAEVRAKQRNMHKQLSLWYDTRIVRTTDPKRCTDKQILDTLNNV